MTLNQTTESDYQAVETEVRPRWVSKLRNWIKNTVSLGLAAGAFFLHLDYWPQRIKDTSFELAQRDLTWLTTETNVAWDDQSSFLTLWFNSAQAFTEQNYSAALNLYHQTDLITTLNYGRDHLSAQQQVNLTSHIMSRLVANWWYQSWRSRKNMQQMDQASRNGQKTWNCVDTHRAWRDMLSHMGNSTSITMTVQGFGWGPHEMLVTQTAAWARLVDYGRVINATRWMTKTDYAELYQSASGYLQPYTVFYDHRGNVSSMLRTDAWYDLQQVLNGNWKALNNHNYANINKAWSILQSGHTWAIGVQGKFYLKRHIQAKLWFAITQHNKRFGWHWMLDLSANFNFKWVNVKVGAISQGVSNDLNDIKKMTMGVMGNLYLEAEKTFNSNRNSFTFRVEALPIMYDAVKHTPIRWWSATFTFRRNTNKYWGWEWSISTYAWHGSEQQRGNIAFTLRGY